MVNPIDSRRVRQSLSVAGPLVYGWISMKNREIKNIQGRHSRLIIILCFSFCIVCAGLLAASLRQPRQAGCFSDLGTLTAIESWRFGKRLEKVELSEADRQILLKTCFRRASDLEYPGETPDCHIHLFAGKKRYAALYNEESDIIFLNLASDFRYSYGRVSAPSPGGWTQPFYVTNATPSLLKAFGLEWKADNRVERTRNSSGFDPAPMPALLTWNVMKRMNQKMKGKASIVLLSICSWVSGIIFVLLSIVAFNRWRLHYNSGGRYFDPVGSIVYDTDARLMYTVFSVFFLALSVILFFVKSYYKNR